MPCLPSGRRRSGGAVSSPIGGIDVIPAHHDTQLNADAPALTLYQAEWCPFSSAVREVLTELGIDVALRQVEAWSEDRQTLRELAGTDHIPVLQAEDGTFYRGTPAIFAHLRERDRWHFSVAHRRRFAEHRNARETNLTKQLIEDFHGVDDLEEPYAETATQG
jgi:glutaredoxin 2